jgi:AraC-like DNA-binding protein
MCGASYTNINQTLLYTIKPCLHMKKNILPLTEQENEKKAKAIYHFIIENYNKKITRKSLGKQFLVNRKFFSDCFVPLFNKSFLEVQTDYRMQMAIVHLQSAMNIKEIAHELGYKSLPAFDHAFKKKYNVSPKQYRKKSAI